LEGLEVNKNNIAIFSEGGSLSYVSWSHW